MCIPGIPTQTEERWKTSRLKALSAGQGCGCHDPDFPAVKICNLLLSDSTIFYLQVFASASFPVAVTKRSENKTKQNQLKDEGLSLSSRFKVTVPSVGEARKAGSWSSWPHHICSQRLRAVDTAAYCSACFLYFMQSKDPRLGTISPTVKMSLPTSTNSHSLTTKTTPHSHIGGPSAKWFYIQPNWHHC